MSRAARIPSSTLALALTLLVALITLPISWPARAGEPLPVGGGASGFGPEGVPFTWQTFPINYTVDGGPLGTGAGELSSAEAVQMVEDAFGLWVTPTSSLSFNRLGVGLGPDGDISTGAEYNAVVQPCAADPVNPIVLDGDNQIINDLFGVGSTTLGFAGFCQALATGEITRGRALFSGRLLDGSALSISRTLAIIFHEFGHFLGLGHSQINTNCQTDPATCPTGSDDAFGIPTMYPLALQRNEAADVNAQSTPSLDDIAWISWLYPNATFNTARGAITGNIFFSDGFTGAQGVNVIARSTVQPRRNAVSGVSGFRARAFHGNPFIPLGASTRGSPDASLRGEYRIPGLPAGNYTVETESIRSQFTGGSSVGPLGRAPLNGRGEQIPMPGPPEFFDVGESNLDNPATSSTVAVAGTGDNVSGINIILNELLDTSDAFEPNDSLAAAAPITNGLHNASISPFNSGDVDFYSFTATAGATVTVEIFSRRLSPGRFLDPVIEITNTAGTRQTTCRIGVPGVSDGPFNQACLNDDFETGAGMTFDSRLQFQPSSTGTFVVSVRDALGDGRPDFLYQIQIAGTGAEIGPDLIISKTHEGNFSAGLSGVYTITVTNVGTGPTTDTITVVDTLPVDFTFNSFTGAADGWACAVTDPGPPQVVTCTRATALSHTGTTSTVITITITVGAGVADGEYINTVTVATAGELSTDNNSDTDPTTVGPPPGPPNDEFVNAINAVPTPFQHMVNTTLATTNVATDPSPSLECTLGDTPNNNGRGKSVWYKFTAPANGTIMANANGSNFDAIMQVVTGSPGSFTNVACSDEIPPTQPNVNFAATAGTTYFFMLSDFNDGGGNLVFNLNFNTADPVDADLAVTKSDDADPVEVGATVTYTITVTNNGPALATNVTLTDNFSGAPVDLPFPATPSQGTCNLPVGSSFTCDLGSIASGASGTVTITATANAAGTITNTASASADQNDPVAGNNTAVETTTVNEPAVEPPDLAISKTHVGDFEAGGNFSFTITVTNVGTGPTTGTITVTDTLPVGLSVQDASGDGWTCDVTVPDPPQTLVCTRTDPLGPGEDSVIDLLVSVGIAAYPSATNNVSVSTPGDTNAANDSDSDTVTVLAADLVVTKVDSADPVTVGDPVTYTITITNVGNAPTNGGETLNDAFTGAAVTILSAQTGSGNGNCSFNNEFSEVRCDLAPFGVGESETVIIQVTADEAGTITNTVTVTTGAEDPTPADNEDIVETTTVNEANPCTINFDNSAGTGLWENPLNWDLDRLPNATDTACIALNIPTFLTSGDHTVNTLIVTSTETFTLSGGSLTINSVGSSSIGAGGFTQSGGSLLGPGTLNISGAFSWTNGTHGGGGTTNASGGTSLTGSGTRTLARTLVSTGFTGMNDGIFRIAAGGAFTVGTFNMSGGTIEGVSGATITGDINQTGGTISPGLSPGILNVVGNLVQSVGGSFLLEIAGTGGPGAANGHDQANISGSADVNGTFNIVLINGFIPAIGDTFTVATRGSGPDSEPTINLPDLPPDRQWQQVDDDNALILTVVAAVAPEADLAVTKTDSADPVTVGDTVTYTVIVTNNGPNQAVNVTLSDAFTGAAATITSIVPSQGACTVPAGGAFTCNLGNLANAAAATVTIQVTANEAGTITNTVSAASDTADPNAANNTNIVQTTTVVAAAGANVVLTKTDSADPVFEGENVTYTITVTNNGPEAAENVVVTDTFTGPVGSVFSIRVNDQPSDGICTTPPDNPFTCNLGTLANGETVVVTVTIGTQGVGTITNTVSSTSDTADPVPGNNTNIVETTQVLPNVDIEVSKSGSPGTVNVGETVTYTITVNNAGTSTATNVQLTDTLTGLAATILNVQTTQGACDDPPGNPLNCNLGNIPGSGNVVVTLQVRADASNGTITNTASATANETDREPGDNSGFATTTVRPSADIILTKTDNPDPVTVGQNVTYTATVTNNGPDDVTGNVSFSDSFSGAAVSIVSATPSQGPGCDDPPNPAFFSCDLGPLASGVSATVTIVVTANEVGTITNTATAESTSGEDDPNPANNTNIVQTTTVVAPSADLAVTKTDAPDPVTIGGTVTYTVTVTNNGPSTATIVTLTDTFTGAAAAITSIVASQGACDAAPANPFNCALGNLASGASATVTVQATAEELGSITNTVSATASENDPNPANNTNIVQTTTVVAAQADLELFDKTGTPNPVVVGEQVTYLIEVANRGPNDAVNITLTDTFTGAAVTIVQATTTATGGSCQVNGLQVTCDLGTLGDDGTTSVTIVVTALETGTITNTAVVASDTADPVPANNSAVENVNVNAPAADLRVVKSASAGSIAQGGSVTFTVVVTNDGPNAAANVSLLDTLSGVAVTVTGRTTTQGACVEVGGGPNTSCDLGTLAAGASATVTITVTANGSGTLVNSATATSDATDPNAANNTNIQVSVTVVPPNPVPTLTSINPAEVVVGGGNFNLVVTGTGFVAGSVVRVNGSDRTTTFNSATQLTAAILASDIAAAGSRQITVFSPAPGGGLSNALTLLIADYQVAALTAQQTVARGAAAQFGIRVTPAAPGFSGTVTFSATGLPPATTAAFNPASVTPGANPAETVLTITTSSGAVVFGPPAGQPPGLPVAPVVSLWLLLAAGLGVAVRAAKPERRRAVAAMAAVVLVVAMAVGAAGCFGGFPHEPPDTGTPPGTYPITVRATSGTLERTTQVTLVVQ